MIRFRRPEVWLAAMLLGAGAVTAETAAMAQGASPQAFLESVYKVYRNNSNAKGIDYDKPEVAKRYFAPALAKAMIKDRADAARRNEVPLLNGDPFIDAQDWEIADLTVEAKAESRRRATALVSFTNAKAPHRLTLDLVKTGDGWRIAEIRAPSGSLKELFKVK